MRNLIQWAIFFITACGLFADAAQDIQNYSIPNNAIKVGPISAREPNREAFNYFLPGVAQSAASQIAREIYESGQLIERELFRDGKRFGVWRKWYSNGQLASESSYRDDVKDGLFREWNTAGQLIAQYAIIDGTGIKRVYSNSGELVREQYIARSEPNGLSMEYLENFGRRSLVWMKDGYSVGKAFAFYADWKLRGISWYRSTAPYNGNGPVIVFTPLGEVKSLRWYINGKEVPEAVYSSATVTDSSLPPYFSDAKDYAKFVDEDVRREIIRFQSLPHITIPLTFDERGIPIILTNASP